MMNDKKSWTLVKILPWILLIGGTIATIASISLSVEVYQHLKNPDYVPACNLSPILSCTSVADSPQSAALGFPNYYLGIAGYAAVLTVGAMLLFGAKPNKNFWKLFLGGLTLATAFVHWLIFQSLYRIGSLCIFCMIVWAVTIPLFWFTLIHLIQTGSLSVPAKLKRPVNFILNYHVEILLVWLMLIIALILNRFWYYWGTLSF